MRFLGLVLLLCPPALAQFDARAPQPIERVRGQVIVYGSEYVDHRADFLTRAGQQELVLICAPGGELDVPASQALWAAEAGAAPRAVVAVHERADDEELARVVSRARALFLVGDPALLGRAYAGTALGAAVREAFVLGAVVGARGDSARVLGALRVEADVLGGGLDLLQGALIDPAHVGGGAPAARLAATLGELPMFVGLAVEPTGRLELRQRWLTGVGAHAFLAGGADRAALALSLDGERARADLVSLSRSGQARALRPWPPAAPAPPQLASGTLMMGGGPMPAGTLERFIELAGGPDAPLVYVPCAYEEALESEPGFVRSLRRAGAKQVRWIHTKDRRAADGDPELLTKLQDARGVWFGGGRQWNLVDSYQHTQVHRLIEAVLSRGGVVGGSSAGASIQGDFMARGGPLGNVEIMVEGYEEGLGLLTGVAIDQHFTQRGRLPDLRSLVSTYPQYLGIGLDEGAVLVVQGSVGEVMGSAVHFVASDEDGGLTVHRLVGGERFELVRREVLE